MIKTGSPHRSRHRLSANRRNAYYKCLACGYIYHQPDEPVRFRDLPADWTCPSCGGAKKGFIRLHRYTGEEMTEHDVL